MDAVRFSWQSIARGRNADYELNMTQVGKFLADLMEAVNALEAGRSHDLNVIVKMADHLSELEASQKAGAEKVEFLEKRIHDLERTHPLWDPLALKIRKPSTGKGPAIYTPGPYQPKATSPAPCGTCGGREEIADTEERPGYAIIKPCPDCQKSCENCGDELCGGNHYANANIRTACLAANFKDWTPKSEKVGCLNCGASFDLVDPPKPLDDLNSYKDKLVDFLVSGKSSQPEPRQPQPGETAWLKVEVTDQKASGRRVYKYGLMKFIIIDPSDLKRREEK